MGYSSKGRKPIERASKIAHGEIINNPNVVAFLKACTIPSAPEPFDIRQLIHPVSEIDVHNIRAVIALDGGFTETYVREEFPSVSLTFFTFGPLLFRLSDLRELDNRRFIAPEDLAALKKLERYTLTLPTRGICLTGEPTLALEALLAFRKTANLHLCQQFVCNNPARLPSPAQWVNVERIRVKDSFTHLWWMAPSARPKADNRRVLKPYSAAMLYLLKSGKYSSGKRPSQHKIRPTTFLKDHNGAIPSNALQFTEDPPTDFLEFSNTKATDDYQQYCRYHGLPTHPARMPIGLPEFFIKFLTEPGDLVLDPFAGSNTTGAAAEYLGRHWLSIELQAEYVAGSRGRFSDMLMP